MLWETKQPAQITNAVSKTIMTEMPSTPSLNPSPNEGTQSTPTSCWKRGPEVS